MDKIYSNITSTLFVKNNLDFCLNELVGQPSSFFLLSMHIYLEAGYNISIGNTPNRGGTGSL